MRRCGRCGETKPTERFHRDLRRGHQHWCKPCRQAYDRAYHAQRRQRRLEQSNLRRREKVVWFRSLKAGASCADCGGSFHHAAMTYDHLPGEEKLADVSSMVSRCSRARVLAEIAKCEVVCANCHAVRTFERQRGVAQPG